MIDLDKYFIAMPNVADYIFQDHLTDHLLSDIFKVNEQLRNIKHLAEYGLNASKVGMIRLIILTY